MVRTPSCDKSGLRKGTWTPEEDRKLIAYVTRYGCWNWRQLPSTGTKDGKNNSSDHPIKRVTSKEKEFETNLNNLLINPPSPPLILESSLSASLLSPQPASSDQSQNSSITTDNTAVSSSVSDDNNNNNNSNNYNSDIDMALFEAYEANSGSFWTEPFFSDNLFMSSDISVPMMDFTNFEAQFPVLDGGEEILCPSGFYDEFEGLLNF
ncbi:hypothetical protein COLO4_06753 [Corchorus olitorius]|uniref:Uncharacterized protein n=1 Tax=Corchorus olitorius TaxID=93759 RepID=A0A1R3KM27_9ROSI|nr:hypothetical protein COLO4_06753 [Corchorus olitorius]